MNALKNKSAVSLRGIVTNALRQAGYWIVLDHVQSPSKSYANALKDTCSLTETPLIAVTRSAHMEDVGFLLPMFSDRSLKFGLRGFDPPTAREFASQVAKAMHLQAVNRDEAIEKIVGFSKGSPGPIVAMLQMAISPKYVAQEHVKFSPLYIDFRLSWGDSWMTKLSESHRRVIGSGMLITDSAAVRMLDLLDERNSPAAIKAVESSVSDNEKEEIRACLLQLQGLISALVRKYDLEPSKKNLRRILASEVSQISICLEDSRPGRIRGYGPMVRSTGQRRRRWRRTCRKCCSLPTGYRHY